MQLFILSYIAKPFKHNSVKSPRSRHLSHSTRNFPD